MTVKDYVVVGSGLTGATIAYALRSAGHSVLVVERRPHVAGNVHDWIHPSGIRIHAHGPHYFRTSSRQVWDFVQCFTSFDPFQARVLTRVNGQLEVWPVTASYMRRVCGGTLPRRTPLDARTFEQAMLSRLPRIVFDQFIRGYSEKQWGLPAHLLSSDLAKRIPIRLDDDPRLTPDATYQGLPSAGYQTMVERMLAHVPVVLGVDYLAHREEFRARRLTIFTGPIDEYYGYALGRLKYRGQLRETRLHPDLEWYQPSVQVNEPDHAAGPHIRTIEWKHMLPAHVAERIRGTITTVETPYAPTHPDGYEYPFPDDANRQLYHRYREMAAKRPDLLICGRLGEYRYFDMDQAIGRALMWVRRILSSTMSEALGA